jgi:hypothetical protein
LLPRFASFPITHGGIGFSSQTASGVCAYLASSSTAYSFINNNNLFDNKLLNLSSLDDIAKYYQHLLHATPLSYPKKPITDEPLKFKTFIEWHAQITNVHSTKLQQHLHSKYLDACIKGYENHQLPRETKAYQQRYQSNIHEHAGKFLFAIPIIPTLRLTNDAFRIALRNRLQLPQIEQCTHSPWYCNCHRRQLIDIHGDHLMCCSKSTYLLNIRHNGLVQALSRLASEAGIYNRVEPNRSLSSDNGSQKRPDIILYNSPIHGGSNVALDISIIHPVSLHHSTKPCSALNKRSSAKINMYQQSCRINNMKFLPMTFESFGRFNDDVDQLIKKCCVLIIQYY